MATESTDPTQTEVHAPAGCGFGDIAMMPVQTHLICLECSHPMGCTGPVQPLLLQAPAQQPQPDYMHICPSCGHTARDKRPWPITKYVPHPDFYPGEASSEEE